ncbi:hypothetical protein PFISCL1PPCAC_1115, partial [Pristionchus fissidentatus]
TAVSLPPNEEDEIPASNSVPPEWSYNDEIDNTSKERRAILDECDTMSGEERSEMDWNEINRENEIFDKINQRWTEQYQRGLLLNDEEKKHFPTVAEITVIEGESELQYIRRRIVSVNNASVAASVVMEKYTKNISNKDLNFIDKILGLIPQFVHNDQFNKELQAITLIPLKKNESLRQLYYRR